MKCCILCLHYEHIIVAYAYVMQYYPATIVRKLMFKNTRIYFGIALGLLYHATHGVADEPEHDVLVVVVESKAWLAAIQELVCNEAEVHCWKSEKPDWSRCNVVVGRKILILSDPYDQQMTKELWRERLINQGCDIYPVKLDRSRSVANHSDLLRSLHRSLVAHSPHKQRIWDENLNQAIQKLRPVQPIAYLSTTNITIEK